MASANAALQLSPSRHLTVSRLVAAGTEIAMTLAAIKTVDAMTAAGIPVVIVTTVVMIMADTTEDAMITEGMTVMMIIIVMAIIIAAARTATSASRFMSDRTIRSLATPRVTR